MRVWTWVATGLVLGSACGGGGPKPGQPEARDPTAPPVPAYQALATIDGAGDDSAYSRTLAALGPLCNEGGHDLADIAVVTRDVLSRDGVQVSTLEVLRGIGGSVPKETAPTDCDEVAAAWATLQSSG